MKIYIVTKGEYSDYMIQEVFLDKQKAEEYAKYHGANVETYETYDDNFKIKEGYIKCTLYFKISKNEWHTNIYFNEKVYRNETEYMYLKKPFDDLIFNIDYEEMEFTDEERDYAFYITKYFKEYVDVTKYTPDKCKKLLTKIGYDISAEISNYMNEGYNVTQITEMMHSKYKHDVDTYAIEEEKD